MSTYDIFDVEVYPSSIFPDNIYDSYIYDPELVFYESKINQILETVDENELAEKFDEKIKELEDDLDDIGKKSFLMGVAIGASFGDIDPYGRVKRDFHRRSTIFTGEKEDYEKFRNEMENIKKDIEQDKEDLKDRFGTTGELSKKTWVRYGLVPKTVIENKLVDELVNSRIEIQE